MNSVLSSIKKMIGIEEDYTHFDKDIIVQINSTLITLRQIGVEMKENFFVVDHSNTWDESMIDASILDMVELYIYLKVRLIFDPPQNTSVQDSINKNLSEIEFRLSIKDSFK